MMKWGKQEGFTLIELLTVIAILLILASIAIPNLLQYRRRSYDRSAASDLKNAFTAAQAYFVDYPGADTNIDRLKKAGYQQTEYVQLSVIDGEADTLEFNSQHTKGDSTYTVTATGVVSQN
jgi:prepilin-type N-terminal cleavage/methylation domain-containing protein